MSTEGKHHEEKSTKKALKQSAELPSATEETETQNARAEEGETVTTMKTVLTYPCECGEDFYEDDESCLNCGNPIDRMKLQPEKIADITREEGAAIKVRIESLILSWVKVISVPNNHDFIPAAGPRVTGVAWSPETGIEMPITFKLTHEESRQIADLTYGITQRFLAANKDAKLPGDL